MCSWFYWMMLGRIVIFLFVGLVAGQDSTAVADVLGAQDREVIEHGAQDREVVEHEERIVVPYEKLTESFRDAEAVDLSMILLVVSLLTVMFHLFFDF